MEKKGQIVFSSSDENTNHKALLLFLVLDALDAPAHRSACGTKASPYPPRVKSTDRPTQSLEDKADNTEREPGEPTDSNCQPAEPTYSAVLTFNPRVLGSLISAESTPASFFPHCPLDENSQNEIVEYHPENKSSINNKTRICFHFSFLSVLFLRDYSKSTLVVENSFSPHNPPVLMSFAEKKPS